MNTKPTRRQRHAIYKKALELFDHRPDGLCHCILEASNERWAVFIVEVPVYFKEMGDIHRELKVPYGYWWPLGPIGHAMRREALRRCIALTAPKAKP